MRVLITGGTGQVAAALLKEPRDFDMVCLSREVTAPECHLWDQHAHQITPDPQGTFDAIVHLAGATPTGGQDYAGTADLAHQTMALAQTYGITRCIIASSLAIYGPPIASLFTESDPCHPNNPYGLSKQVLEDTVAQNAEKYGLERYCSLRLGNFFGGDQLGRLAKAASCKTPLNLSQFSDGQFARRSYFDARLLAAVITKLLHSETWPDVLNIAAGTPVGMDAVATSLGAPWRARAATQRDVREIGMDCSAFADIIGPDADLSPQALLQPRQG